VPSGGHTSAERVAQFLSLANEGADFVVILDNGPQTTKTKSEIEARFGHRVQVDLPTRTDIEGFLHSPAVITWLHLQGVEGDDMEETI